MYYIERNELGDLTEGHFKKKQNKAYWNTEIIEISGRWNDVLLSALWKAMVSFHLK